MSFDTLKKNSSAAINKLVEAAEKITAPKGNYGDDDYWKPTVDKSGNGYAIIRFLPAKEGEDLPWVQFWDHGFKGDTGRWYIEKSLTSIGQADPVSEANSVLWNTGRDEDKETARKRKRRLHYVSNIEVVSDPSNPDNDGKVFKYKFGKKIFDKIMDVMQPQFADEDPINPFDFWAGANFKLKIRNVEGYRNYDKSEFDSPSPHRKGDDAELKEVYENLFALSDLTDPANYKSYDELKRKFQQVIGEEEVSSSYSTAEQISLDETASTDDTSPDSSDDTDNSGDSGSPDLAYFAGLAKG